MHKEIKTPSEAHIQLAEEFLKIAAQSRLIRLQAKKQEKECRRKAFALLEIPVVKLP